MITSVTETSLVETPWPMFHYNAQHTGQSRYNGPQTNNLKWKYTWNGSAETSPASSFTVGKGDKVYVAAARKLLALSSSEGELLWSASLEGTGATALSPDKSVIYAVGGSNLYAFTLSGEILWTFDEATENIWGEPSVATDGTIYCGSWDTYVYAVNPDGTLKWKYQTDGAIAPLASPTLSNDETTIYVGSGDPNQDEGGTLYALSSAGTLRWSEKLDNQSISGAVVGEDGKIYVCASRKVQCFSSDGTKIWESDENTASSLTPSLSSAGTIYVGTGPEGKIYAINASDGSTLWSYQTGANPDYNPEDPHEPQYGVLTAPIIGADGVLYVGAMDRKMYALNSDGTLLWTYETGDSIVENCPAIGSDGTLYFSSEDGYIYAIRD